MTGQHDRFSPPTLRSQTRRLRSLPMPRRVGCAGPADAGAAAVLLVVLTPALLALGGLLLDGGSQLAARQRAADLAEQAARAGADQLDTSGLRASGTPTLNSGAATLVACQYVRSVDPDATCSAQIFATAGGQQVQVRIRTSTPTVLLGLVGITTLHTDALGTATAVVGIRHINAPAAARQPAVRQAERADRTADHQELS